LTRVATAHAGGGEMADDKLIPEYDKRKDENVEYDGPPEARVREDDLEPHAGLRYVARLFKVLAILLIVMLVAEIIIGLTQQGSAAIGTLLVEATRTIVFAGLLWGIGDIALMLIESNHDMRATRILVGRINQTLQRRE
jgi:hypothetical protein